MTKRNSLAAAATLLAACVSQNAVPTSATSAGDTAIASTITTGYGMTVEEEAPVLRLEDRREFDRSLSRTWSSHPNALHRKRIALALGRIGPHTFDDGNSNGVRDADERMAGVDLLISLTTDPASDVREAAVFALGEIGDPAALPALFISARDTSSADVAAEAVEAIAKMASAANLAEYVRLTEPTMPEGVRSHAARFLFRWNSDDASARASALLDDASPIVRREASYALSRRVFAGAREKLELLLTDNDANVRAYSAQALGRIALPESYARLITALGDIHPWVRTNAARAVAAILEKAPATQQTQTTADDLLRVLNLIEDPDPGTRVTAIEMAGHYAARNAIAKERLFALLENGSRVQREIAAGVLTKHFGATDSALVERLLSINEPWLHVRVAENSARTGSNGKKIRDTLSASAEAMVRSAALGAIPEDQRETEKATILRLLEDKDPVVRSGAIDSYGALASINSEDRFVRLRDLASSAGSESLNDARLSAVNAMAAIDSDAREELLRGLLGDRDPVVRRLAADGIATKLEKPRPQYTPLAINRSLSDYEEIIRWSREKHTATIKTARGDIELVLLPQEAPMTAKNFADLAKRGYFDNTSFMRVVPNFVIQGGDPRNDMSGGPGYSIRDEINLQKYTRGAVGMALSGPDTGGSQFFVTHSPQPHLDGGYTIFARVVDGMGGVVDQMERGDRVNTIAIDAKPYDALVDINVTAITPLPTEIGTTTRARLLSAVPDYDRNLVEYVPDSDTLQLLSSTIQPGDRLEIFLGTWCDDSQREVPRMLKISDELSAKYGIELPTTFVAVNRGKNEPAKLIGDRKIEKVATFILYRGDKELGRIVEKPDGLLEDVLLQISSGVKQ